MRRDYWAASYQAAGAEKRDEERGEEQERGKASRRAARGKRNERSARNNRGERCVGVKEGERLRATVYKWAARLGPGPVNKGPGHLPPGRTGLACVPRRRPKTGPSGQASPESTATNKGSG